MKVLFLSFLLASFSFIIVSCDFLFLSTFPDFLPDIKLIKNLNNSFDNSIKNNYDMFVINDGTTNDFIFVLYKPESGNRKVLVLNTEFDVLSEYEDINLGSIHMCYAGSPGRALVGTYSMSFSDFTWNTTNIAASSRDHIIIRNFDSLLFYVLYTESPNYFQILTTAYDNDLTLTPSPGEDDSCRIDDSGKEYILENAAFYENGPDVVILIVRRMWDNQVIGIVIPASDFPELGGGGNTAIDNYYVHYFGEIKPGSVHFLNGGMSVIMENYDGKVVMYGYNNVFYRVGDTNARQFKDKIVGYSPYNDDFYVFDPATKDIFKCQVWWKTQP